MYSVLLSGLFLCGRAETIKTRSDADILQADLCQVSNELCLRQSASDSPSPEVNVALGVIGKFDIQRDICQMQATPWF